MNNDSKPAQNDQIRKVLATALMADDFDIIDATKRALLWFEENPDFLIKHESLAKD